LRKHIKINCTFAFHEHIFFTKNTKKLLFQIIFTFISTFCKLFEEITYKKAIKIIFMSCFKALL
jgi:hypothetical protein